MHRDVHIVFPSQQMAVRRALEQLARDLEPMGLSPEDHGTIELVLAEALNNVVEHAYENDPGGTIDLRVAHSDKGLKFSITDFGIPMPDGELPLGREPDPNVEIEALPEGGFGWFLIRDLTHELIYAREHDQNVLTFRLALTPTHVETSGEDAAPEQAAPGL